MMHFLVVIVLACTAVRAGTVKSTVSKEVYTSGSGSVIQVSEKNHTWTHRVFRPVVARVPAAQVMPSTMSLGVLTADLSLSREDQDVYMYVGITYLATRDATHWGVVFQSVVGAETGEADTWTYEVYGEGFREKHMIVKDNTGTIAISPTTPRQHPGRGPETARYPGEYDGLLDVSALTGEKYKINSRTKRWIIDWVNNEDNWKYNVLALGGKNCQCFVQELYRHITKQECPLTMDTDSFIGRVGAGVAAAGEALSGLSVAMDPGGSNIYTRTEAAERVRPINLAQFKEKAPAGFSPTANPKIKKTAPGALFQYVPQ